MPSCIDPLTRPWMYGKDHFQALVHFKQRLQNIFQVRAVIDIGGAGSVMTRA